MFIRLAGKLGTGTIFLKWLRSLTGKHYWKMAACPQFSEV